MAQADLRRVAKCRQRLNDATKEWDDAVLAATVSGESTRDIAQWAGVSHQLIHQMVTRAQREGRI